MMDLGEMGGEKPPPWPGPNHQLVLSLGSKVEGGSAFFLSTDCKKEGFQRYHYLFSQRVTSVLVWTPLYIRGLRDALVSRTTHLLLPSLPLSILTKNTHSSFSDLFGMAETSKNKGKEKMVDENSVLPHSKSRTGSKSRNESKKPEGITFPGEGRANKQSEEKLKSKKLSIDVERLKSTIDGVKGNIENLNTTSLFATIIGEPVEAKIIRKKIQYDWKFLAGGFQLIPMANHWFELRFDLPSDRERVWVGRPFFVVKQMMLIRPWRIDFNPLTEPITTLDVWVRYPGLPTKHISDGVLKSLTEENGLGKVLKVAAFNKNGSRLRYPRVCVSVDITRIRGRKLFVMNEEGVVEHYPIWFEFLSDGCGSCGLPDHVFNDCPKRKLCSLDLNDVASKDGNGVSTKVGEAPQTEDEGGWVKVGSRKNIPPPPPRFGHSKADLLKSFGMNSDYSSDSSTSKSTDKLSGHSMTNMMDNEVEDFVEEVSPVMMEKIMAPAEGISIQKDIEKPILEEPVPTDSECLIDDDEDLLDYEDDPVVEDGCGALLTDFDQEDFESMFLDIPTSVELNPTASSNPAQAMTIPQPTDAPVQSTSMAGQLERLGMEGSSKTESSKRKQSFEDVDTACSELVEGGGKRGK